MLGAVAFERIPGPLIGRVTSMSTALAWSLMPLGGLLGGLLVDSWSLPAAMLVCGAAYLLVTMAPAIDPRWKAMDVRPPAPPGLVGPRRACHARRGVPGCVNH